MSDFTVIESQEQLDAVIGERLKRERETNEKKFEGWTSPDALKDIKASYEEQIKALQDAAQTTQQTLDEKDAEIAKGEQYRTDLVKTRIALRAGLGIQYADRLKGESEEEWKKDAEILAKDFKAAHQTAPLGSNEPEMTKEPTTEQIFKDWFKENL